MGSVGLFDRGTIATAGAIATPSVRFRSKPEQRCGMPAQDFIPVRRRNAERSNVLNTVHHAHVVGIIAAEKYAVGARRGDEEFQRRLGVADSVVAEALQIFFRRVLEMHFGLRPHVPAMDPPAALIRRKAAAMHHDGLEIWMALEHATEDQAR